jgi:putative NADH-flavin reductase
LQLVDTPDFPALYKPASLAHREALKLYQKENELDWTFVSPSAVIEPGERTGKFRTGTKQLLSDANGKSFITMEDYAVAVIDEIESPLHVREVMTVGY